MVLLKEVLLLLAIAGVEGLGKFCKFKHSSQNERTVKTIFESCYPNDNLAEPMVIYGDFKEVIDRPLIARLNHHALSSREYIVTYGAMTLRPTKFLLTLESPENLERDLLLLWKTAWWNHMAHFFIVAKSTTTCEDFRRLLEITWKMNIPNAIFICAESTDATALYTLNPMTNYAPHPWKRLENLNDLNVFHQVFDANASCKNLNYDKMKNLSSYEIKVGRKFFYHQIVRIGKKMYPPRTNPRRIEFRVLDLIIQKLDMYGMNVPVLGDNRLLQLFDSRELDITFYPTTLSSYPELRCLFPYQWSQMIAVVKLSPERSTLQKIIHMWSPPVLIAASIVLLVLSLILTVKNGNFFLAMLDIVRLLTYTSILTNTRGHWFRVYFTTMLIFMVISNGVFQGQIAAFLTKQERVGAVETIDELVKLNYHMYTSGTESFATARCSECIFKEVGWNDCIHYALNSTLHVCGINRNQYEAHYALLPLEIVKEILNEEYESFKCRRNWPLEERFNNAIMRLVESGIIDFWKMQDSYELTQKRREMEAEWASAQYKPVRLYKLEFAFQILAYGLGLAIIAFFLELCCAKYGNP